VSQSSDKSHDHIAEIGCSGIRIICVQVEWHVYLQMLFQGARTTKIQLKSAGLVQSRHHQLKSEHTSHYTTNVLGIVGKWNKSKMFLFFVCRFSNIYVEHDVVLFCRNNQLSSLPKEMDSLYDLRELYISLSLCLQCWKSDQDRTMFFL
jgi:hypothetical protein